MKTNIDIRGVCDCPPFRSSAVAPAREVEREARKRFLQKHGDGLDDDAINKMTSDEHFDKWATKCDCEGKIIGVVHYEKNDWYLCTVKGLAVDPERRGEGLGSDLGQEIIEKAEDNPNCLVLAADITYDNDRSLAIFEKGGFKKVGQFCWEKGEKPADILHFIRYRPLGDKTCTRPYKK